MKIMHYLDKLWDEVTDWFESIGEDIMDFVKPLAKEIASSGGKVLLATALEAVKIAEGTGGSGPDKFKAAQNYIVEALKSQGLPIVINAINGAIEAAVASLKK